MIGLREKVGVLLITSGILLPGVALSKTSGRSGSAPSLAQTTVQRNSPRPRPPRVRLRNEGNARSWRLALSIQSGVGQFNDLQVPINWSTSKRADGTTPGSKTNTHIGVPIEAGLGLAYRGWLRFDGRAMLMASWLGPRETSQASYRRYDGRATTQLGLRPMEELRLIVGGGFGLRRSEFRNTSTRHYVDSTYVHGFSTFRIGRGGIGLFGLWAFDSSLGYDAGPEGLSGDLEGAQVDHFEAGMSSFYRASPSITLAFKAYQEAINLLIPEVEEYRSFGLTVDARDEPAVAKLRTNVLELGIHRSF